MKTKGVSAWKIVPGTLNEWNAGQRLKFRIVQIGRGRNVRQSTVLLPASLRINTRHAGTRNDRFAVRDQNLNKGAVSRSGSCTTEASALLLCSDRMRKIRGMLLLVGASRWPAYSSKLPVTVDNGRPRTGCVQREIPSRVGEG
jgi:hypothetical protein